MESKIVNGTFIPQISVQKYFQSDVVFQNQVMYFMSFQFQDIVCRILSKIKVEHDDTIMNKCELR